MKSLFTVTVLLCAATVAFAQLSIVSTSPAPNATNVPLLTTISATFSEALDTSRSFSNKWGSFSNLDGIAGSGFSPDQRTFTWYVTLEPDKSYFVNFYYAKAAGGALLAEPYCFHFTTGAAFPPYTVSGSISPGTTGISPSRALVLLSLNPVGNQDPLGASGVTADIDGNFIIPHVGNGTYWPVAAKDVNGDGDIDPSRGDVVAIGEPIVVSDANYTGVALVFIKFDPLGFHAAIDSAQNYANSLPPDRSLRMINSWDIDPQGLSSEWEFDYSSLSSTPPGYSIYIRSEGNYVEPIDQWRYEWISPMYPLGNLGLAADASTFMAKVEASGGQAFRNKSMPDSLNFHSYAMLGDMYHSELWSLVSDTTKQYWGAVYMFARDFDSTQVRYEDMRFLGDYSTGDILGVTSVGPSGPPLYPERVALEQNYPNPFNPATTITYSLPHRGPVRLEIFNALGERVASLVEGVQEAGEYHVRWNAESAPSGVYFYRLMAEGFTATRKLRVLR
jgi:hypothetical protein